MFRARLTKAAGPMGSRALFCAFILSARLVHSRGVVAQEVGQGKWADENDPVARQLIEQERKWATVTCNPNDIYVVADFIADDFVGTHPKGSLYTKPALPPKGAPLPAMELEHDCKLLSAKVRFYGSDVAVIYGSESALAKGPDGKEALRTLIWTDTVLRRGGRWQVIAVQDMVAAAK